MTDMTDKLTPKDRGQLAKSYFEQGYNCAQAVLMAFEDRTSMDADTAARVASSFGGGMGRMREVCGTVSGAYIALGMIQGYDDPADKAGKDRQYAQVREFAKRFKERNGIDTIICRELLSGVPHTDGGDSEARTNAYYQRRPCSELCALSAEILAEMLDE